MDPQQEIRQQEEIKNMNLKILKNMDPKIKEILIVTYCSLHEFDKTTRIWHACETAGPLFIVRKEGIANYGMILLNTKNMTDFEEDIFPGQKFELKEDEKFLFFQTKHNVVKGLYINNINELRAVHKLITDNISKKK